MNKTRAVILAVFVTAFVVSVFWIGAAWGAYKLITRVPPPFDVVITAPAVVDLDEKFDLKVNVSSLDGKPLNLASIDFYDELLNGFEIVSVHPAPLSKQRQFGFSSFYYRVGKTETSFEMRMSLRAKKEGEWIGDIDCCTPLENFASHSTAIEVRSKVSSSSPVTSSGDE